MKHLFSFIAALLLSYSSFAQGPIMGTFALCDGLPTTLTDAVSGGVWSSSNLSIAAVGSASGVVTGLSSGICIISYTISSSTVIQAVTVNPTGIITGTLSVCMGYTTTLTDASGGGTWSSSMAAVATVSSSSGVITGGMSGTSIITYTLPTGCISTAVLTVNPLPTISISSPTVCLGGNDTVTGTPTGGTWSSSNITVAPIYALGIVQGVSAGTSYISYTAATGCFADVVVTVNATLSPITGTAVVCPGFTTDLSDVTTGAIWSSATSGVATITSTGVVTGITPGTVNISYTFVATGCTATQVVTVNLLPAAITGVSSLCVGGSATLSTVTTGGTWSATPPSVITMYSTGLINGLSAGTAAITYTVPTGCAATYVVTVATTVPAIGGDLAICIGGSSTLSDVVAGGTWTCSTPAIITLDPVTGVATALAVGTADVTYSLSTGCLAATAVTVNVMPTINATSATNCGGTFSLTGSGAGTGGAYVWSPSTGLSCATCATAVASISSGITYSVTGTTATGCSGTNTITLNANRISGYISLSAAPTDTLKVWLIQFNPSDSSLTGEDSTLTCMDSGTPYYEFDGAAAGSYMVKAKLLSSVAGTSGYVPTYGLSSPVWDSALSITHSAATDTQHINMIYGTVPTGPGFIGGLISSGAGKGTSGSVPVAGMLIYLRDNTTNSILTYTYTDATGAYSFSGIGNGSYVIYPVDYHYQTVPWTNIVLSPSNETINTLNFYEHTTTGTITPFTLVCCDPGPAPTFITVYPNPAADEVTMAWGNQKTGSGTVSITDITGKELYKASITIGSAAGKLKLNTAMLANGIYIISIRSGSINYTNKLQIAR